MDRGPCHREGVRGPVCCLLTVAFGILSLALAGCSTGSAATTTTLYRGATLFPTTETTVPVPVEASGVLELALPAAAHLDPQLASTPSDVLLSQQVYDRLVEIDAKGGPIPSLATSWNSRDGTIWTFTLRSGVTFHDGAGFDADDVVFSFDRLRDTATGASAGVLFKNIIDVRTVDALHVQFLLAEPDAEFLRTLADPRAAILSKGVRDPSREWLGTGPFVLESYLDTDRAVLSRNPSYWSANASGTRLPYLDGLRFVFVPEASAQIEALFQGDVQFVGGLTPLMSARVQAEDMRVVTSVSNGHYTISMRTSEGRPTADTRVRLALRLGTDHQGIIDRVRSGFAVVGNGTPVGPSFGDAYLDVTPTFDAEQARALLAEAGFPAGLDLTLQVPEYGDGPAIAAAWKSQMAAIGVNLTIATYPAESPTEPSADGAAGADLSLTYTSTEIYPLDSLPAGGGSGGAFTGTHWVDEDFADLVSRIRAELVDEQRVALYRAAQQALVERGPLIVPYMEMSAAGVAPSVQGLTLAADWPRTVLRGAYLAE